MTEEAKAERRVGADAVQSTSGNVGNLMDGVRAQIAELLGLQVAPDLFDRVEVVSIAWQRLDPQPVTLAVEPVVHASAVMRGQPVPDQHHRSVLLKLMQLGEELDERFVVVGARTQLEDEMRVAAIRFVGKCTGQGQPFPVEPMVQDWRVAAWRPGRPHRWQQGHARLVLEHDQRVLAPCPFSVAATAA